MLRFLLPVMMLLVYLPMAQALPVSDEPWETDAFSGLQGFSVLESNKEVAYQIERSLETVETRVEYAFEKGELSREKWEEFKQLHWEAKSFVHLFIMANLYYEEAPVDTYAHLVELFARDMIRRLILLDRFCIEIGIEAIPYEAV